MLQLPVIQLSKLSGSTVLDVLKRQGFKFLKCLLCAATDSRNGGKNSFEQRILVNFPHPGCEGSILDVTLKSESLMSLVYKGRTLEDFSASEVTQGPDTPEKPRLARYAADDATLAAGIAVYKLLVKQKQ